MKTKTMISILLVILIFSLSACNNPSETPEENNNDVIEQRSQCDSYSEGPRKVLCYAMEAKDITMCADIEGRFREECVVVLAELVPDTSLGSYCSLSNVENNQKICKALIAKDIQKCFDWGQGEGLSASLSVRDCIDLTSRKLRDINSCDSFITQSQRILTICGDTSDCKGQWIDGATEHAESCKYAVEEAINAEQA